MFKQQVLNVVVIVSMIFGFVASPAVAEPQPARAHEAGTRDNTALVLGQFQQLGLCRFQRYIQPYLDHFGIPYTVHDITTTPVSSTVLDKALIIVGHRELDLNNAYLDSVEQARS